MCANSYNVARHEFPGQDLLLVAVAYDCGFHGNITLQARNDVGSLLFLVETDKGVQSQDTANDTEINPVVETHS